MNRSERIVGTALSLLVSFVIQANANEWENEPINYSKSKPRNAVVRLQEQIDSEQVSLSYDDERGYLPSLLKVLDIPRSSQLLVFSKTSLQRNRITPQTPRAIYFNDDVYIGYCQNGDVLEISVADPSLGTVFYTLDQGRVGRPLFARQTESCLICHASSRTQGVPGHLVRSVYSDRDGLPIFSSGSYTVDHSTPFEKRGGGWYVSGTHGSMQHLGNLIIDGKDVPDDLDLRPNQNVTELSPYLDTSAYETEHSDVVALSVLAHQTYTHNLIAKASIATRQALHYQETLNRELGEPEGHQWDSTRRRIESAGEELVEAILFADEWALLEPIAGTSSFQREFESQGPFDTQKRSLRKMDLSKRLFKYPCSYLVYSESFSSLPAEALGYVGKRLRTILAGEETSEKYNHLDAPTRTALREILVETSPALKPFLVDSDSPGPKP